MPLRIEQHGPDVLLWIKVVPGASQSQISGILGDRLKIRIAAPPEGGKANAAICELLAAEFNLKSRQVIIEFGHATAEKTVRIAGVTVDAVLKRIKSP